MHAPCMGCTWPGSRSTSRLPRHGKRRYAHHQRGCWSAALHAVHRAQHGLDADNLRAVPLCTCRPSAACCSSAAAAAPQWCWSRGPATSWQGGASPSCRRPTRCSASQGTVCTASCQVGTPRDVAGSAAAVHGRRARWSPAAISPALRCRGCSCKVPSRQGPPPAGVRYRHCMQGCLHVTATRSASPWSSHGGAGACAPGMALLAAGPPERWAARRPSCSAAARIGSGSSRCPRTPALQKAGGTVWCLSRRLGAQSHRRS